MVGDLVFVSGHIKMIDETLLLEIVSNQGWSFPLDFPLILDSKLAGDNAQQYLRLIQYINQDGLCLCQQPLDNDFELHHALISRKDAMGLPDHLIHSTYNTILLHQSCHKKITRFLSLVHLSNTFGIRNVQEWYQSVTAQMKGGFRHVGGIQQD